MSPLIIVRGSSCTTGRCAVQRRKPPFTLVSPTMHSMPACFASASRTCDMFPRPPE